MSTLNVVAEILREVAPRALCAKEIADLAGTRLPTASKTPQTVVSRDLAIDVRDHGAASRFLRVDRGEFVLKEALPTALYNDSEGYVAQWTRNLIEADQIAKGVVDERSIRDLKPADVASYRQFHAFSGIGTWSRALRDAGWPDDVPVWSGSCPCQPFSQAGRKAGFDDDQHLWPEWFRLIKACRPPVIFAEQVASKDGLAWLDVVQADLEGEGYSVRAIDLCAAGFGAPHIRQRLYIVAVAGERGCEVVRAARLHDQGQPGHDTTRCGQAHCSDASPVSDATGTRCEIGENTGADRGDEIQGTAEIGGWTTGNIELERGGAPDGAASSELGDASRNGAGQHGGELPSNEAQHAERSSHGDHASVFAGAAYGPGDRIGLVDDPTWGGTVGGFWARDIEWIYCRPAPGHQDGCFRPAQSGTQPLVDGTAEGVGRTRAKRLRAFGNGIVLPQATEFIGAVIDALTEIDA